MPDLPEWASLMRDACKKLPQGSSERKAFLGMLDGLMAKARPKIIGPSQTVFRVSTKKGLLRELLETHFLPSMMAAYGPELFDVDTYFLKGFPMDELASMVITILRDGYPASAPDRRKGYDLSSYQDDMLVVLKYIGMLDPLSFRTEDLPPELRERLTKSNILPFIRKGGQEALLFDEHVLMDDEILSFLRKFEAKLKNVVP